MAITDKIQRVTNFFSRLFSNRKNDYYQPPRKSITTTTKNIIIDFVEKYKGIRRTILVIVLWINIHIFFVTIEMYRRVNSVDTQWVVYAGYWTAILGTFIGFYTTSRVREFNSNTPYSKQGEWLSPKTPAEPTAGATEFTPSDLSSYSGQDISIEDLKV